MEKWKGEEEEKIKKEQSFVRCLFADSSQKLLIRFLPKIQDFYYTSKFPFCPTNDRGRPSAGEYRKCSPIVSRRGNRICRNWWKIGTVATGNRTENLCIRTYLPPIGPLMFLLSRFRLSVNGIGILWQISIFPNKNQSLSKEIMQSRCYDHRNSVSSFLKLYVFLVHL